MTIEEIAGGMRRGDVFAPGELAQMRMFLAGEYAYMSQQLSDILGRKPAIWNELRKDQKSDTATERVYQATKDGLRETKLRLEMKSIEKLLSVTRTQIEIMIGESQNLI